MPKPVPDPDDQPLAEPSPAIARDLTGEEHLRPDPVEGPDVRLYRVRPGDTLGKIARRVYGNANEYPRLIAANRDRLGDNDEPIVGSELRIPPAA